MVSDPELVVKATMTSKGQVTIPVSVRRKLRLVEGSRLAFVEVAPDTYELRRVATRSIRDLDGILPKPEHSVSVEEMNEAIASSAARTMGD